MSNKIGFSGFVVSKAHHQGLRRALGMGATVVVSLALMLVIVWTVAAQAPSAPASPRLSISITAVPTPNNDSPTYWVSSGDRITYTIVLRNTGDPASSTTFTSTLPNGVTYVEADTTPSPTISGDDLVWSIGDFANGGTYNITLVVELTEPRYILHEVLELSTQLTGLWNGTLYQAAPRSVRHYVESATIVKSHTSMVVPYNNAIQAVAGELVTVTVEYVIPDGTVVYSATPRIILEDSLWPNATTPVTTSGFYGLRADLDAKVGSVNILGGYQLEFDQYDVITGPQILTYTVVAHPQQYRYISPGEPDDLLYDPILRWCDSMSCSIDEEDTAIYVRDNSSTSGQVDFITTNARVDLNDFTHTYLDAAGVGAGGEQVRLNIRVRSNGPTAYEPVVTATLGSELTYVGSSGELLGEGSWWVVGDLTYITWTLPSALPNNTTWDAQITATLPSTFVVGTVFTATADVKSETFPGDVVDEGIYVKSQYHSLLSPQTGNTGYIAGLDDSKVLASIQKDGSTWTAKIGDTINYTVVTKIGSDTILNTPFYTDTLPLGFHYVDGSFAIEGITLSSGPYTVTNATLNGRENLAWYMPTLDRTGLETLVITTTYQAELTGFDTNGLPVYATSLNSSNATNSAVLSYWFDGAYTQLAAKTATVSVRQPNLRNSYFQTSRVDFYDGDEEIGERVIFHIDFRNTGGITGYDLTVCDDLPQGLAYFPGSTIFPPPSGCPDAQLVVMPDDYAEGTVCWVISQACRNIDFDLDYQAQIMPTALPGIPRTNNAHLDDYSSQSGGTNDGDADDNDLPPGVNFDRHYLDYPAVALPEPQQCTQGCPFTVIGLAGSKRAWQSSVTPADMNTYTLAYTNTNAAGSYENVVITDTYGVNLSFVSSTPAPSINTPALSLLGWDVGSVAAGANGQIVLTLQVAPQILNQYEVTNTMAWNSDTTLPQMWTVSTVLEVPSVSIAMLAPPTAHAGEIIPYTIVYSNTGSSSLPVTFTLTYGDYVTYDSHTGDADVTPEGDNLFVDALVPNDGSNHTLTVYVGVDIPLPYTLESFMSSVTADSVGMPQKSDSVVVDVDRPVLVLEKIGPEVAPAVSYIAEYTIRVQNLGNYTATGMMITDTWGTNLGYGAANDSFGWVLSGDGTYATQSLGELGIGEVVTRLFQMTVL
ncbi:MAG: hypothetical protein ACK2UQ_11390, partial [Anaerolineae bacterium]